MFSRRFFCVDVEAVSVDVPLQVELEQAKSERDKAMVLLLECRGQRDAISEAVRSRPSAKSASSPSATTVTPLVADEDLM